MNEERLPIWSAAGLDSGHSETKTAAHIKGLWHPVAQIWLCRTKSGSRGKREIEFLLQLRSGEKDNFPNCWDVSVAGHVSVGESIREAALRELHEELGIELSSADLRFLFCMPYYAHYDNGLHDCEWQYVYLAYLDADFDNSRFRLQQSEVSAVRWVTLAQLRRDWADFVLHYEEAGQGRSAGRGFALHRHYPSESGPIQKAKKEQQNTRQVSQIIEPNAPKSELTENHYWKELLSALHNFRVL